MGKINFERLLYTHYQHPNLESAQRFFEDFGLVVAHKDSDKIYFRGFGDSPYVYIAEQSPCDRRQFVGGGWVVASRDDLVTAANMVNSTPIQRLDAPGGGEFVDIKDPNGINVRLIHGVALRTFESLRDEAPKPVTFNNWIEKPRKGEFQRFEGGPSKVHKLGHYGLVVDKSKFDVTVAWYLDTFNFLETDSLYDGESGKNMMTFMHIDKGDVFTDHHSFFIQSPPFPVPSCVPHHSSFEVDDMDTQLLGHYYLEKQGWTNCWGVGRHLLGSQIFDYWFDCSGNIVEHYSDGDVVNRHTQVTRERAAEDTMAVWGPNVTLAFLTGRIEDMKK